jgi:Flp pilus assembly protein TadG
MVMAFVKKLIKGAQAARLVALVGNFRGNRRGNVAIITALAALPMVAAVGCVIDYTTASMVKTKLQAAADAASLATVSMNSSAMTTAKAMSGNGTVSGGSTYATTFFNANLAQAPESTGYTPSSLTSSATVSRSGTTVTALVSFTAQVPTYFMGIMGFKNIALSGTSTASYTLPTYINFYLMLDVSGSMSFPSTAAEQARLMAVNPDNLYPTNSPPNYGYPQGCQFACHFTAQGACQQCPSGTGYCPQQASPVSAPVGSYQGPIPAVGTSHNPGTNPSPGGYCQGFIISRLGTTPVSFGSGTTNPTNGNNVNWSNTPVTTCSTAGTTSCIQLRADAVGYAVNALLSQASTTESNDGISSQFQVGLFPFIQNLCTSSANSSNSCSVGLTSSLTGSTISNFAEQLANLLDTGQNATLGSGGTHFENALSSMNSFISSVGTGSDSSNGLPYVFIVTDGSQDYQTQSGGNWGSQNWSSSSKVPYQNSATVLPTYSPNDQTGGANSTDYCTTMKNRGVTIAILYIPYTAISDPNASFASDEDGYANSNIQYIPSALQSCASTNFFYTANTPADIQSALVTMFEQAVSTAHITN